MVARPPDVTMCKNVIRNRQRLGKVDHPHIGTVTVVIHHKQRAADQLTQTDKHTQAHNEAYGQRHCNNILGAGSS